MESTIYTCCKNGDFPCRLKSDFSLQGKSSFLTGVNSSLQVAGGRETWTRREPRKKGNNHLQKASKLRPGGGLFGAPPLPLRALPGGLQRQKVSPGRCGCFIGTRSWHLRVTSNTRASNGPCPSSSSPRFSASTFLKSTRSLTRGSSSSFFSSSFPSRLPSSSHPSCTLLRRLRANDPLSPDAPPNPTAPLTLRIRLEDTICCPCEHRFC